MGCVLQPVGDNIVPSVGVIKAGYFKIGNEKVRSEGSQVEAGGG